MKYSVTKAINDNFSITVAGKIIDEKGFWYKLKKERKIKLIDNYISDKHLKDLIKKMILFSYLMDLNTADRLAH